MGAHTTLLAVALAATLLQAVPAHADRSALWQIVHDSCLPQARDGKDPPQPCDGVDLAEGEARGVAFLKDRVGVAQLLAIATGGVSGIEDPSLLEDDAPNYFALAWREGRPLVDRHLGSTLPREDVVLAINARSRRSQDQLHIHIDCIDPSVAIALAGGAAMIGDDWHPLSVPLDGRIYWARRLVGDDLAANPFHLLAEGVPAARTHMGDWSLAVIGASIGGRPGFVLLADRAALLSGGHAEDLEDHTCAIAKRHGRNPGHATGP